MTVKPWTPGRTVKEDVSHSLSPRTCESELLVKSEKDMQRLTLVR